MTELLLYTFFWHYIADFIFQSREMGKRKSTEFPMLLKHIGIQFGVLGFALMFPMGIFRALIVSGLNALVHGVIDWNIWKGYKSGVISRLTQNPNHPLYDTTTKEGWRYWEDEEFYSTIGMDQMLHIATLTILIKLFF